MAAAKSKFIMYVVNILLLLAGMVVTGVSAAAKINRGAIVAKFPQYAEAVPSSNLTLALASGAVLLAVAIFGIIGTCCKDSAFGKLLLIVYILLLLGVLIIEVAAVAVVFVLTGNLGKVADKVGAGGDVGRINDAVNNFTRKAYDKCCNETDSTKLENEGCNLIKSVVNDGNCANYGTFRTAFINKIKGNLKLVGGITIGVAAIQFITMCAACCLVCSRRDDAATEEEKKKKAAEANGEVAYNNPARGQTIDYA